MFLASPSSCRLDQPWTWRTLLSDVPQGYVYVTESAITAPSFARNTCRYNFILFRIDACLTELDANNVTWEVSSSATFGAAGRQDLRSAVAHEFGHAMGFEGGASNHVNINCNTWSNAADGANTMCGSLMPSPAQGATKIYRTAAPHEATDHATNY